MSVIPNILHFIWVGEAIPDRYADNIVYWAALNPRYSVRLWTQHKLVEESIVRLRNAYHSKFSPKIQPTANIQGTLNGATLAFFIEDEKLLSVEVNRIESLHQHFDFSILAEEITAWKNYGAASDILRLNIVYEFGGIYMDTDTYPNNKSLPQDIEAPYGYLTYMVETADGLESINCIMASEPNGYIIEKMMKRMQRTYKHEYEKLSPGVYGISSEEGMRFESVQKSREILSADPDPNDPAQHASKLIYSQDFVGRTVHRQKHLLDNISLEPSAISFQLQSGYYPVVRNEGSWRPESRHFKVINALST